MIVECPSCSAKFNLPDTVLDAGPRRLKCSKCAHMWTLKPPTAASAPIPAKASKAKSNKALIHEASAAAAAVVLLITCAWLGFLTVSKGASSSMVALTALELTPEKSLGGERFEHTESFTISGAVINQSSTPQPMPRIRIRALTNDGDAVYTKNIDGGEKMIPVGEKLDFSVGSLMRPDPSIVTFSVEIGSARELKLRPIIRQPHA